MYTANRRGLLRAVIMLGVVLALAAVVTTSNTPVHANSVPDLEVVSLTATNTRPTEGGSFALYATVSNDGDGESAATTLRYYQSTDATISSADMEVGTNAVGTLAAGGTSPGGSPWGNFVVLYAPSPAGTYYYRACVDAVTGESDTTNNCSASVTVEVVEATTSPDLQVGHPRVTDSTVVAGGSFTLSATVSNAGAGASEATTLRYYLRNYQLTDGTISDSKSQVGTDEVGTLAASETSAESISLTARSTAGTYYYGVCVDVVPLESDTTNNCSGSVAVTVNNLATGAPTISGTAQVGQTLRPPHLALPMSMG